MRRHIYFFILAANFYIVALKRCGIGRIWYDDQFQGCCFGKVYNKTQDGVAYDCCTEADKLYKTNEETCCGNLVQNNQYIKDLVCCENNFRHKDKGLCCKDKYYSDANRITDRCCDGKLNRGRQYMCCNGRQHDKITNGKCCGTLIFNKTTDWCKKKQHVVPLGEDLCYGTRYVENTHLCCYEEKRIQKKQSKEDDGCCGFKPYFSKDYYCINKKLVSKIEYDNRRITKTCGETELDSNKQQCCNGSLPFDPKNDRCCGGTVIDISDKCCNGKKLDTAYYTCCKNEQIERQVKKSNQMHDSCCFLRDGSTETFNSIKNTCSLHFNKVIPNKERCGGEIFNISTDICCGGVLTKNGKVMNMTCCGIKPYHLLNQACNAGVIKNRSSIHKRKDPGPMCGNKPFNASKDLCCSGIFRENGITLKMKCCGVKSFFTQNQTCRGTSLRRLRRKKKRLRVIPCTCPKFCKSLIKDLENLANITNICRYKVFKITKEEFHNKTGKRSKPRRTVKFKQDCTCTCGDITNLILLARKVTRSGNITEPFYLIRNKRQFSRAVRRLKKRNRCKNRKMKRKKTAKG